MAPCQTMHKQSPPVRAHRQTSCAARQTPGVGTTDSNNNNHWSKSNPHSLLLPNRALDNSCWWHNDTPETLQGMLPSLASTTNTHRRMPAIGPPLLCRPTASLVHIPAQPSLPAAEIKVMQPPQTRHKRHATTLWHADEQEHATAPVLCNQHPVLVGRSCAWASTPQTTIQALLWHTHVYCTQAAAHAAYSMLLPSTPNYDNHAQETRPALTWRLVLGSQDTARAWDCW